MSGLPEITMFGTLTADPELRYTSSGTAVCNFTVAANDRRLNRTTGQWEDGDATFLRCTLWRQAAENVAESLRRGNRVMVVGQLRQRSYETKEGEHRTAFELDATEVGVSLKWATAKVSKATRTGAANATAVPGDGKEDPWGTAPAGTDGGFSDEPPF